MSDQPAPETAKPKRKAIRWIALGGLGVVLLIIIAVTYPVWGVFVIWGPRLSRADAENKAELAQRRDRYEAIVRAIASLPLPSSGQVVEFSISTDRDPSTLKKFDGTENERFELYRQGRVIKVYREDSGRLNVQFLTKDLGHMGMYWLLYSDIPEGYLPVVHNKTSDKLTPLAPSWWAVYDPAR